MRAFKQNLKLVWNMAKAQLVHLCKMSNGIDISVA